MKGIILLGDRMKKINVKENEIMFVKYINSKKICELNSLVVEVIEKLFGSINYNDIVYSWLNL